MKFYGIARYGRPNIAWDKDPARQAADIVQPYTGIVDTPLVEEEGVPAEPRNIATPAPAGVLTRNQPYVAQGPTSVRQASPTFNTTLAPLDEIAFRQWVVQNKVPFNPDAPSSDYDMRGFWRALQNGDPRAKSAVNPNDQQMHYPDVWKTPAHETFSSESQWAAPGAPQWNDKDQLISPGGRILKDERAPQQPGTFLKNMSAEVPAAQPAPMPMVQQPYEPNSVGDVSMMQERPLPPDRNTYDATEFMIDRAENSGTRLRDI